MKAAAAAACTARLLALSAQGFQFGDGGYAIYFSFDKSVQRLPAAASAPAITTYLFVLAGSDCTSMKYFMPQYFDGLSGVLRISVARGLDTKILTRAGDRVVLNRGKVISETSKSLAEAAYAELMLQFGGRGARPVSVHQGSGMSREQV